MILDERKAYTYIKNRFVMRRSTNGFFSFDCPFCINGDGKRKHAVNFEWGFCKCFVCGFRGYLTDFVQMYEGVSYHEAKSLINQESPSSIDLEELREVRVERQVVDMDLPVGFTPLLDGSGVLGDRARKYLEGRGFDLEQLDKLGFGYCNEHAEDKKEDYFGYIIVPYKRRGVLCYFQGRDFIGNFLRYKNPPTEQFGIGKSELWFNEDALEMANTNYITEGWADAMTMGKGGISSQGWFLSSTQKSKLFKSSAKKLVFLPDMGESEDGTTFYQQAVKLALYFLDHKECIIPNFEAAGFAKYGKDVNEFGKQRVIELIKDTPRLTESMAMEIIMS